METTSITRPVLEKVITPTALILIDDDVVKHYLNADVEFSKEDAANNLEAIWDFIKHKKVFHLIVPDSSTQVTMRAEEFADERFESIKLGEAFIIKTLAHRILANAFTRSRRRKYPVNVFENELDALDWFDSLRESKV